LSNGDLEVPDSDKLIMEVSPIVKPQSRFVEKLSLTGATPELYP